MKKLEVHIKGFDSSGMADLRELFRTALEDDRSRPPQYRTVQGDYEVTFFGHKTDWDSGPKKPSKARKAEPLTVSPDPLERKGSLPWVKYKPGHGWSIYSHSHKPGFHRELVNAVAGWNTIIKKTLDGLNLRLAATEQVEIDGLPGWGDAIKDEIKHRHGLKHQAEPMGKKAFPTEFERAEAKAKAEKLIGAVEAAIAEAGSPNVGRNIRHDFEAEALRDTNGKTGYPGPPMEAKPELDLEMMKAEFMRGWNDAATGKVDFKAHANEAQARHERKGRSARGLLGLLSMMEAIGGLDECLEGMGEREAILDPSPEIVAILERHGVLLRSGGVAMVAIPRANGEDFAEALELAIRAGDAEIVAELCKEI